VRGSVDPQKSDCFWGGSSKHLKGKSAKKPQEKRSKIDQHFYLEEKNVTGVKREDNQNEKSPTITASG